MGEKVFFETRNLCKSFGKRKTEVRALEDLSLIIREGSFSIITGPSGCGKTTLLSLLGALDRPGSGEIFCQGTALGAWTHIALARLRRRMGFVYQKFSLIAGLPVWENITYPLVPRGISSRERRTIAQTFLAPMGMEDKLLRLPGELSGGEMQRVAIARALAGQPEIILADEPVSNLDPVNSQTVLSLLKEFHATGKTVVLSIHDKSLVSFAATIYELDHGKLKSSTPLEPIA